MKKIAPSHAVLTYPVHSCSFSMMGSTGSAHQRHLLPSGEEEGLHPRIVPLSNHFLHNEHFRQLSFNPSCLVRNLFLYKPFPSAISLYLGAIFGLWEGKLHCSSRLSDPVSNVSLFLIRVFLAKMARREQVDRQGLL